VEITPSTIGTPQGGPPSPLLSNILLDQLDKELEGRNVRFARYADDAIILTKRLRDANKLLREITIFLEKKLKLVVNQVKTKVAKITECSFLGFTFKGKKVRWTDSSFEDFRHRLKYLTRRSWGWSQTSLLLAHATGGVSMEYRLGKLKEYIRALVTASLLLGYAAELDELLWNLPILQASSKP